MKNYQYKGQASRKVNRRRRKRINKLRFSIFIIICLMLLIGLGVGVNSLVTDKVPVSFLISDDLNEDVGTSEYQLTLNWEPLAEEKYKEILISIDEKEYILQPNQTTFSVTLDQSNQTYDIKFKAKKKGVVISKTVKKSIQTGEDNARLSQVIDELNLTDSVLTIKQTLKSDELKSVNLKTLNYQLVLPSGEVVGSVTPTNVKKSKDQIQVELTIPLTDLMDYHSMSLMMSFKKSDLTFMTVVNDQTQTSDTIINENANQFQVGFVNQELIIMNHQLEHYDYMQHNFYAESLHVDVEGVDELITTYQLIDERGETVVDRAYDSEGNKAIDLSQLEPGRYFIYYNQFPIYTHTKVSDIWYTVTRDGGAHEVNIETSQGMLSLDVKALDELPENVYDVLIDPGHGGLDTGAAYNGLLEAEETLKISEYIAKRLTDHGLKVKLTRTEDLDPAGEGNFNYEESMYYINGRVEQAYQYKANYMISSHLNSFNKVLEGFEVYTSIVTTNDWAQKVAQYLIEAGQAPRDSEKSEFRVSEGTYKKSFLCKDLAGYDETYGCKNDYMDYLYIIRETGGKVSQASGLLKHTDKNYYTEIPNYGAETMLIEYAYIDNQNDSNDWKNNWEEYGEAVVKATLEYLNIPYQSK